MEQDKNFQKQLDKLRFEYAIDQTRMANERTLLAFIRTAMTLLVPGFTFFHLTEALANKIISVVIIAAGIFTFLWGGKRFIKKKKLIDRQKELFHKKTV